MISYCCSLFLTVFFLCSFHFACFLFSSLGSPQAAVPLGYPCSSVGHPWAAASSLPRHFPSTECLAPRTIFSPIPDNVPFHVPPPASAFVFTPVISCTLTSPVFTLFFPITSPHMSTPERLGPLQLATFQSEKKRPSRIMLQLAEILLSSYPGCCCLSAWRKPPLWWSLQHLASAQNAILETAKPKRYAALGVTIGYS